MIVFLINYEPGVGSTGAMETLDHERQRTCEMISAERAVIRRWQSPPVSLTRSRVVQWVNNEGKFRPNDRCQRCSGLRIVRGNSFPTLKIVPSIALTST